MIAAMPDSISREELMREVGDRLDADPGLVARRVAGAGRGGARRAPATTRARRPAVRAAERRPRRGR